MSRGSVFGSRGNGRGISARRGSGEPVRTTRTGSAAWTQQPHVIHVGAQVPSSAPARTLALQGSGMTRLETPDALMVSNETMIASANRLTIVIVALGAVPSYKGAMRSRLRPGLLWCLVLPMSGACAGHGAAHVAPDESRPHITWEIRTGGDLGDDDLICGSSQPSRGCILTASTEQRRKTTTVHLYLHAASQPTSYLGFMRLPFIEGSEQRKGGEVNASVAPGSRPVGATVSGGVTSKAGSYTFSIALDATQPTMATPQRIAQEVVVTVK
jgi:hypothetical protein